jgi:hypothetical protein
MEELWFEEELQPTAATAQEAVKGMKGVEPEQVQAEVRGIVRADTPRWRRLNPDDERLTRGSPGTLYKVRLGFQFVLPEAGRDAHTQFVFARCAAYLWPVGGGEPQPVVYDLYPRDLYEGEPRRVTVKLKPDLKVAAAGGSLGEVSSEVDLGQVEPVVVGWPGEEERAPYWELRPRSKKLLGWRHLWVWIEVPEGCSGVRLAALVDADLQTRFGPIAVGPRERVWDRRPSVVIRQ